MGGTYDISLNPVINVRVKPLDQPFLLHMYLYDDGGNNVVYAKRVLPADDFVTICWDFTVSGLVDKTSVTAIQFTVNGAAKSYAGSFEVDEITVGADATMLANLSAIPTQTFFYESTSQTILITDIENASAITVSGGATLIENIVVSAIANGMSTITFDCIAAASGTQAVTITAVGTGGFSDNSYIFNLTVEDNIAPTIDPIGNVSAASDVLQTVDLTGITDGNITMDQALTITATSDNVGVVGTITPNHATGSPYGSISFTPSGNQSGITVTVTVNDGGLTTDQLFTLDVFSAYNNPPTLDAITAQEAFVGSGPQSLMLTGISDGDVNIQTLDFVIASTVDSVADPLLASISYIPGQSTALLNYTPDKLGITTITLTLSDNGDTGSNNGNEQTEESFTIEVREPPLTGWIPDMIIFDTVPSRDSLLVEEQWMLEQNYVSQVGTMGNFHGFDNVLHLALTLKNTWNGLWLKTPDLDLTEFPLLSFDIYVENFSNATQYTHVYFWDAGLNGDLSRNSAGANDQRATLTQGQWEHVLIDFRAPGLLDNSDGEKINVSRIQQLLFNYHESFGWPFTTIDGDVYIKNIRIGDLTENIPVIANICTIDEYPDVVHVLNAAPTPVDITLTGLSEGDGNTAGLIVTATSNNAGFIANPTISAINPDGTATLTYTPGTTLASANITIDVSNGGSSIAQSMDFIIVTVTDVPASAVQIDIDLSVINQSFHGFGTHENKASYSDLYAKDMGLTAMRLGACSNQIEPVNDNNDPYTLNRETLNYDAFDWDYLRYLHENGVESFIYTSFSPPAWMKDNLSTNYQGAGAETVTDNTNNRLSYHLYEEFAESMVAAYRMFEEESGIQLLGIGLQNEPVFHEPYCSAILDEDKMVDLINVVGARFALEGIDCDIFMPEQVFTQNNNSMAEYIDAVQADATANEYCDVVATHNYATNGIDPGAPDNSQWTAMWNNCQETAFPKELWMSEASPYYVNYQTGLEMAANICNALEAGNVSLWTLHTIEDKLISRKTPTTSFYAQKNYSKFIRTGAVRVNTTSDNVDILATTFINEVVDGENLVTVLVNKGSVPVSVDLGITGGTVPTTYKVYQTAMYKNCEFIAELASDDLITIPAMSITTIVGVGNVYTLTITSGSGSGDYPANDFITITADAPPVNQEFDHWVGNIEAIDDDEYSSTTTVTMPAQNISLTATYRDLPIFDLTVNRGSGSGQYLYETVVNIDAEAAHVDSVFYEWTGDVDNIITNVYAASTTITMPVQNTNITATYISNTATIYTLDLTSGTINNSDGATTQDYLEAATANITADAPATGYAFDAWTGDITALNDANSATAIVTMPAANVTLTATYVALQYNLIVNNGSGSGSYAYQAVVPVVADSPHADSLFYNWSGGTVADANAASTTLTMPAGDVEISANYIVKTFDLTFVINDGTNPIQGASIAQTTFGNQTTDVNGEGVYASIEIGTYGFSITATGFENLIELVTINSDTTVTYSMVSTGIEDLSNLISIYPNPATDQLNVVISNTVMQQFSITDISGRLMLMEDVNAVGQFTFDVSILNTGIYIISVNTDKGTYRSQLIIE